MIPGTFSTAVWVSGIFQYQLNRVVPEYGLLFGSIVLYCLFVGGRDDDDGKRALVFVHQSDWQLDMLKRYGCDVCLLDATYNTTVYGMPLFMLCVLTNRSKLQASQLLFAYLPNDVLPGYRNT